MALEGVGLGLALLSEVSKAVKGMQELTACYKEAPVLFSEVDGTLVRLMAIAGSISDIVGAKPEALPRALRIIFIDTVTTVRETLWKADDSLSEYCSEAFFGGSSGGWFRDVANKGEAIF